MSGARGAGEESTPTACASTHRTAICWRSWHTPEVVSNLCFGGVKRNRLFMTGSTSIYALYVNAVGTALS
jgi:sugar lactone lactonase YvrE